MKEDDPVDEVDVRDIEVKGEDGTAIDKDTDEKE